MNEQKTIPGSKGASSDERIRKVSRLRTLLNRPELGALGGTILVFSFFGVVAGDSGMFSVLGIVNFVEVSSLPGIVAIAAALLMISGEFDLSVGSMIAFAGVCIAIPITYFGWPLWFTIIVTFEIAILVGLFNGLLTVKTGLPSFIVTLAMLFILRGATVAMTRGISGRTQIPGLKKFAEDDPLTFIFYNDIGEKLFTWFGSVGLLALRPNGDTVILGFPVSVIWFIVLLFLATWLLIKTRFGNWIFAAGGDANGARNAGVPVTFVKSLLFKTSENEFYLCLVSGDQYISEEKITVLTQKKIVKANAEEVKKQTGFSIGGVSPVAHLSPPTRIFIDANLNRFDMIYAAAGHPYVVFGITFNNLCLITKGEVQAIVKD